MTPRLVLHRLLLRCYPREFRERFGAPMEQAFRARPSAAEYRGAQAFILTKKDALSWTITRLEALRTTSFAVKRAWHRLFLTADGGVLGQSDITIDNQGK